MLFLPTPIHNPQVDENYSYFFNFGPNIYKYRCLNSNCIYDSQ